MGRGNEDGSGQDDGEPGEGEQTQPIKYLDKSWQETVRFILQEGIDHQFKKLKKLACAQKLGSTIFEKIWQFWARQNKYFLAYIANNIN